MASIAAGPDQVESLLPGANGANGASSANGSNGANGANGANGHGAEVVIAGYNGPAQTVISGPAEAVERVCRAAAAADLATSRIPVSHAFHSPMVAPAAAG